MKKVITIIVLIIVATAGLYIYWKYYYVFGDGMKTGYLNYIVRKGDVFKTWEGKLIQVGVKTQAGGAIQSNEFEFSVVNDSIANILQMNSGKLFDLHYKEFHGVVVWRGYTNHIVDQVVRMRNAQTNGN